MLDKHLVAVTRPKARKENIILWKNYRITVLQDRLFRMEYSPNKKFRDEATQSVWFRDMPTQEFSVTEDKSGLTIQTARCKLIVKENRKDCRVELDGKELELINAQNLGGTYRTLDCCNGRNFVPTEWNQSLPAGEVPLGNGVCSLSGVAVFNDENSLTLGVDGEVKAECGDGLDEYVFAYGDDYRGAVKALYLITGNTPMLPRYALGNWWSRYYVYTDKSYLKLLNLFEEKNVPLTVATIDMDWHYSTQMEEDLHITELGRNTLFYGGNNGWTGYTWNKRLFPDYRGFLKKIEEKDLKITLNLHPADGFRWWEDCYEGMAKALGKNPATLEKIQFDIASTDFINAYFSVAHKPYERDGVSFWWIDWQQGTQSGLNGLDPLWALNHYHYLDNLSNHSRGLILSRYSGIGSHRYPLGFSGDTHITWETLDYLPEFTATASNVGYGWWSHDIGGHMLGEKNDELYTRHVQFGVFSPINRLHGTSAETCTKEPWVYGNGAGLVAMEWLRLRHRLIPYLYTACRRNSQEGLTLVEPLYYEWKQQEAYEFKNEYLFGGHLLVAPVTKKAEEDGYARVNAWLPEGVWTDIFTGERYTAGKDGKKVTFLRELETIPVLMKQGGILPLSLDKGNSVRNPETMEICVFEGNGEYTLYEDGSVEEKAGEVTTLLKAEYKEENGTSVQSLTWRSVGDSLLVPENRKFSVRFKDIPEGEVSLYVDGEKQETEELLTSCAGLDVTVSVGKEYRVEVVYSTISELERLIEHARRTLISAKGGTNEKQELWLKLRQAKSVEEYVGLVEKYSISPTVKELLKETL